MKAESRTCKCGLWQGGITAFHHSFSDGTIGFKHIMSSTGSSTTQVTFRFLSFLKYKCKKVPVINCNLSTSAPVSESEMFYNVVTNCLQDLGRATLNPDYKSFFVDEYLPSSTPDNSSEHVGDSTGSSGGTNRVTWGPIGIGDRRLWWGQPDACVRPLDSDNPLDSTLVVATLPDPDESDRTSAQKIILYVKVKIFMKSSLKVQCKVQLLTCKFIHNCVNCI